MRKLIVPVILVPALLIAIVVLLPLRAFAAVTPQHHTPHFFLKSSLHGKQVPLASNLTYHGGPVMNGTANVYAIFWEPTGNVQAGYNSLIQRYFGDVNGTGLYHNNTQYHNSYGQYASSEHLVASWVDNNSLSRIAVAG